MEADPYQGFSTAEQIHNEEQGCTTMTELIRDPEEQPSVFTYKAITWEISPLPGVSTQS